MRYEFGNFELNDERFELKWHGKVVPVQRRVLDTILYLIANRETVVTKDDLVSGPWRGVTVTDAALNRAIMMARKTLQDRAKSIEFIKTVRGRGYLWTETVREIGTSALASEPATASPISPRYQTNSRETHSAPRNCGRSLRCPTSDANDGNPASR